MRLAALLALLVLVLGLAGCGGGDDDGGDAQPPPAATGDGGVSGEAVFTGQCGSCHTLEAAGTDGAIGPNLDDLDVSADEVEQQVREGGGGMPAFEGRLSDDEIQAVSEYVSESAGG